MNHIKNTENFENIENIKNSRRWIQLPYWQVRYVEEMIWMLCINPAELQSCNPLLVNETTVWIWQHLEQEMTLEDLVAAMREIYNVEEVVLREDVMYILQYLEGAGVICKLCDKVVAKRREVNGWKSC